METFEGSDAAGAFSLRDECIAVKILDQRLCQEAKYKHFWGLEMQIVGTYWDQRKKFLQFFIYYWDVDGFQGFLEAVSLS